jgi:hypothetical protein
LTRFKINCRRPRLAVRRPPGSVRALVVCSLLLLMAPVLADRAAAAVLPWMDLEEIAGKAEVIALGTVESAESAWSDDGRIIVTRAAIAVERALKGGPRARVIVETPGGRVGDQTMIASSAPVFAKGERVVLFLEASGPAADRAERRYSVVGWNLGCLWVHHDPQSGRDLVHDGTGGALYLDREGRPIDPGRRGAGPAELQDYLRRVEALVQRGGKDGVR